jgi:hypothetical protein
MLAKLWPGPDVGSTSVGLLHLTHKAWVLVNPDTDFAHLYIISV